MSTRSFSAVNVWLDANGSDRNRPKRLPFSSKGTLSSSFLLLFSVLEPSWHVDIFLFSLANCWRLPKSAKLGYYNNNLNMGIGVNTSFLKPSSNNRQLTGTQKRLYQNGKIVRWPRRVWPNSLSFFMDRVTNVSRLVDGRVMTRSSSLLNSLWTATSSSSDTNFTIKPQAPNIQTNTQTHKRDESKVFCLAAQLVILSSMMLVLLLLSQKSKDSCLFL